MCEEVKGRKGFRAEKRRGGGSSTRDWEREQTDQVRKALSWPWGRHGEEMRFIPIGPKSDATP